MFCKFCANEIDENVVICPRCGKQVSELKIQQVLLPQQNLQLSRKQAKCQEKKING